jgi:HSP20 family protein
VGQVGRTNTTGRHGSGRGRAISPFSEFWRPRLLSPAPQAEAGTAKKEEKKMAVVRWDPFRELTALQTEVNRLFSRVGGGDVAERQSWTPAVDVVESEGAITLKADLAGMNPADISIEVQDSILTVSGERRFQEEVKEDKYYRIERRYGSFSRSLALPQAVDEDGIEAKYENGLLEVTVPKAEIARPKRITVAVGEGKQPRVNGAP